MIFLNAYRFLKAMPRLSLLIVSASPIFSCAEQPHVEDKPFFSVNILHSRFEVPCYVCHESSRLPPSDGVLHGFGRDCGECHQSQDGETEGGAWKALPYDHTPPPEECSGCHGLDRPSREGHPESGDCYSCHEFPAWSPAVFK